MKLFKTWRLTTKTLPESKPNNSNLLSESINPNAFSSSSLNIFFFLIRIREEQDFLVKDLQSQVEKRQGEVDRIKRDKTESLSALNHKTNNLQDMIKNLQELNDQRKW